MAPYPKLDKEVRVTTIRNQSLIRRNDRCPCGSGKKFKVCHSPDAPENRGGYASKAKAMSYIDTGEAAVRYVICDSTGVKFFSDVENRILVFGSREEATAIALLEDFSNQEPGEINVAGVGPTKWEHLQSKLPFIEVKSVEHAVALVRERIAKLSAQETTEEVANDVRGTADEGSAVGGSAEDHSEQQPDGATAQDDVGTGRAV